MNEVKEFIELYDSPNTINMYRSVLGKFFSNFYNENEWYERKGNKLSYKLKEACDEYFSQERDYDADFRAFWMAIKDKAPKSTRTWVSIIKNFFEFHGIAIDTKTLKRINRARKSNKALTEDYVPSREEMRRIFNHMPLRGRAFYLVLASSGMRIGEAVQLKMDDLNIDTNTLRIKDDYTKGGACGRSVYFSDEAKEHLVEWLNDRPRYIAKNSKPNENRIFPNYQAVFSKMLYQAVRKAGLERKDENTNRRLIHSHVFRKFFRTELAKAIPLDVVEDLMGHEGYLTGAYRRYDDEYRKEAYLKGVHKLTIYTDEEVVKQRIEEETSKLQGTIASVVDRTFTMEQEVDELRNSNSALVELVGKLMTDLRRREAEDQEYEYEQRAQTLAQLSEMR